MKKILFIASAILILLSGCENFLDSELLTEKTTANFPETEKDAQEMVTAIYAHLLFESPETSSQYYIAQLAGDDCLGGNLSYSNNCATNFLMYSGNLNTFAGIWDRCYTLINRANNAINTMENVKSWSSESERNRLFGESYFLRAMAYYELAQVFGGVPLRTTLESTNLPRASVDEIYAQIAADLKNAIEMMPAKIYPKGSDMTGHATKYAAEAMMARVFLFYTGRYEKNELPNGTTKEEVISGIDACVNNSGHKLVSDQRNIWAYTNDATEDNTEGFRYQYVINHNLKWEGNSSDETLFANKHNLIRLDLYLVLQHMRAILFTVCRQLFQQRQLSLRHRLGSWPCISGYGQRMERLGRQADLYGRLQGGSPSDRFHMVVQST